MDKRFFHVTIKGLFFDARGRVLLIRERDGDWDLPGGRLEHGEEFHAALARECREEMGLDCEILDRAPFWSWSARDRDGVWKVVLCFRIRLPHLDFTPSEECVACEFFDATGLAEIPLVPQIRRIGDYLREYGLKAGAGPC